MIHNKLTYISLFSSAGVGCYGFKQEDYECIVTNEILAKRLNIQRINEKCKYDSGYIQGDIREEKTKSKIFAEIKKWHNKGNDKVDVVIATPPCQGMSIANRKRNEKDLQRNSLIVESVEIIKQIKPRIFIFENVATFWKTSCISNDCKKLEIGKMIKKELNTDYLISNRIINFKDYGSKSSRKRTLVIGVNKKLVARKAVVPWQLYPDYQKPQCLGDVIGDMPSLNWGEYDPHDFFHSFRTYHQNMRAWISDLKEGESAFDNTDPQKIPHHIKNGKIVFNKKILSNKYTRQRYDQVAACVHTRNDQLSSQNTVHPKDDRVFSIRELMRLMTIPDDFKWLDIPLKDLNTLSLEKKQKLSKKVELTIRQSIGEAVPTIIFRQIAQKIKKGIQ